MDPVRFRSSAAGKAVRTLGGYDAFVPAPLPPKLDYGQNLVLALSRADAALSELSVAGEQLPNPHLLIAPYLRQEAVLSSRIEGTRTTLSELLMDEVAAAPPGRDLNDLREVRNYIEAHRSDYYEALLRVRTEGDWESWLLFFLRGVQETAVAAAAQARKIMRIREEYQQLLQDHAKALALVDEVLSTPYITVAHAQKVLGVSNPTARTAVSAMVDAGLLAEVGERKWRRLYVARPVLDVLRTPLETM